MPSPATFELLSPFPHWNSQHGSPSPRNSSYFKGPTDFLCFFCRCNIYRAELFEHFVAFHNMAYGADQIIEILMKLEGPTSLVNSRETATKEPRLLLQRQFAFTYGPSFNALKRGKRLLLQQQQGSGATGTTGKSLLAAAAAAPFRSILRLSKGMQTDWNGLGVDDKGCQTEKNDISSIPTPVDMSYFLNTIIEVKSEEVFVADESNKVIVEEIPVIDQQEEVEEEEEGIVRVDLIPAAITAAAATKTTATTSAPEIPLQDITDDESLENEAIDLSVTEEEEDMNVEIEDNQTTTAANNEDTEDDEVVEVLSSCFQAVDSKDDSLEQPDTASSSSAAQEDAKMTRLVTTTEATTTTNLSLSMMRELLFLRKAHVRLTPLKKCLPVSLSTLFDNEKLKDLPELRTLFSEDKTSFSCEICGVAIETENISVHVSNCHKVNLLQYVKLFHPCKSWMDACLLQCRICNGKKSFYTTDSHAFRKHIYLMHGNMLLSQYSQMFGSPICVESRFQCILCPDSVLHSFTAVKKHLKKHGSNNSSSAREYLIRLRNSICGSSIIAPSEAIYVNSNPLEADEDLKIAKKKKVVLIENSLSLGTSTRPSKLIVHALTDADNTSEEDIYKFTEKSSKDTLDPKAWMNKCTYRCIVCSLLFHSLDQLSEHAKRRHKSMKLYRRGSFGKQHRIMTQHHKCHICDKLVVCDGKHIEEHLKTHFITVEYYYKNFVAINESSNKPTIENGNSKSQADLKARRKEYRGKFQPNGCLYSCRLCPDKEFNVQSSFRKHLETHILKNQLQRSGIKQLLLKSRTLTTYHRCKICDERLVRDYTELYAHFKSQHRLSLREYKTEYLP